MLELARIALHVTAVSILIGLLVGAVVYAIGVYLFKAPQQVVGVIAFICFLLVAFL